MTRPLTISWSALRIHEECRQKALLMREGKRNPVKDLRNYYPGMVVDRVMQEWLRDPRPGAMRTMVDDAITAGAVQARETGDGVVRWRNPDDRDHVHTFCLDLVTRLEPILTEHILPHTFHAPYRFKVPVVIPDPAGAPATVHLIGEMDLLVQDHGWVVWDLKGTADDQYWRRVLGQLVFYDLAVFGIYGQRSRYAGFIQPMCPQPVIGLTVTDDMRRQLWSRICTMAHHIWTGDTACKQGTSGCVRCEVRHACPRYAPEADTLGLNLRRAAQETA
jgi:hypothetical protein